MHDFHRPAAKHIGGANHHRIADPTRDGPGLVDRTGSAVFRLAQAELLQEPLKPPAILGQVDRIGRGAEDRDPFALQRRGELQRGLPAELHDHAEQAAAALFDMDDLDHVLGRQRLEIEPVRRIVIGRYGLRIAIDHDRFEAGLAQAVGGMNAAIVEFDPLADPIRSAAEDHDLFAFARIGLAFGHVEPVALVARIHVGSERGELGRASVDALVDRPQIEPAAARRHRRLVEPGEPGKASIRKAHLLQPQQAGLVIRQPVPVHLLLDRDDLGDALQKPSIELAAGVNLVGGQPMPVGLRDQQQAVGRGPGEGRFDRVLAARFDTLDRHFVKTGKPGFHRAQRLLHRFRQSCARSPSPRRPISSRSSAAARCPETFRR